MKTKKTQLAFSIVSNQEQGNALSATLDLSTLEAHLWESANILRGPVDAADFKTYIFPLLPAEDLSSSHRSCSSPTESLSDAHPVCPVS